MNTGLGSGADNALFTAALTAMQPTSKKIVGYVARTELSPSSAALEKTPRCCVATEEKRVAKLA